MMIRWTGLAPGETHLGIGRGDWEAVAAREVVELPVEKVDSCRPAPLEITMILL